MNAPARTPSPHEGAAHVRRLARLLDDSISIPGIGRIGLDPLIGLIPGVGDVAGAGVSFYLIARSARVGAPRSVLLRMAGNVALETVVGTIPLLGDLFDAGWKANSRNAALLEAYLARPERTTRGSRAFVAALLGGLALLLVGSIALSIWILSGVLSRL